MARSSDLSIRAVEQPLFHGEAPQGPGLPLSRMVPEYQFCLSARVPSHKTKVYLKLAMFEVDSAMDEGRRLGGGSTKGVYVYV